MRKSSTSAKPGTGVARAGFPGAAFCRAGFPGVGLRRARFHGGGSLRILGLALLSGVLMALAAPQARAQLPSTDPALQDQALGFAQAWVNSEVESLQGMMEPSGVQLQLQGGENFIVLPSQARAAISSFMRRYQGGEAELFRVSQVGGDPDSGFAEFRWTCQVSGLRTPVIFSLFVAFRRNDADWMVTEIRVLS